MEGRLRLAQRLIILLGGCLLPGGCIHSDSARSGVIEGRPWSERVADEATAPYVEQLRGELLALGGDVSEAEAAIVAETAVRHADYLRRRYDMVKPIELHNVLVNIGLRKRGLCYQCAEDMFARLRELKLQTFQLHWAVAHKGDLWLEHSGVIVTPKGLPFSKGMVLDAWRHSGRLRWARVEEDRYPWVEMIKLKFVDDTYPGPAPAAQARRPREEPANDKAQTDAGGRIQMRAVPAAAPAAAPIHGSKQGVGRGAGDEGGGGARPAQRVDRRAAAVRAS